MSSLDLCVFDLDGTLVDSLQDIAESLNECLELLGLPTHSAERCRYMVGEGIPTLCRRAIGESHPHLLERLIELARARYRARPLRHTRPYAGVPRAVTAAAGNARALAVLSNKPHEMTVRVVNEFWPAGVFAAVRGYTGESQRKPDPAGLLAICEATGASPARTCLVGDTPTDVETARRAGALMIGVTWGFRTREDLLAAGCTRLIDQPAELEAALRALAHD